MSNYTVINVKKKLPHGKQISVISVWHKENERSKRYPHVNLVGAGRPEYADESGVFGIGADASMRLFKEQKISIIFLYKETILLFLFLYKEK